MISRDSGRGTRGSGERPRFWGPASRHWRLRISAALSWLLAWTFLGAAQKPPSGGNSPNLRITIWVHDYARVKPSTLARAEREATRILGEAEVNLLWQSYSPPPGGPGAVPASQAASDATLIRVIFVEPSKAYALTHPEETLGITPMSREGERDTLVEVFLDRVRYQADYSGLSVGVLLGHAIAHELGHVLLRTSGHVSTGIMRAGWTPEDLRLADSGLLIFTSRQAELIRNEVRERAKEQAATEVATGTHSQ